MGPKMGWKNEAYDRELARFIGVVYCLNYRKGYPKSRSLLYFCTDNNQPT